MSIAEIKPTALPVELRIKIERVASEKNLSWRDTIFFLAREVVSPCRAKKLTRFLHSRKVVSPTRVRFGRSAAFGGLS